jgi:hypothetical protein
MTTYRGGEVQLHPFLISALGGDEWSIAHHGRFTSGEEPRYPLNKGTVSLRVSLDGFGDQEISYLNVSHPDVFLNIYIKCRFSQSNTSNFKID